MRSLLRLTLLVLLIPILALLAVIMYEFYNQPQRSGELKLSGLKSQVDVAFDSFGVPHIQATDEMDAYFTLGYLQAQDRLNQMDGLRRIAQGRLAAIFGPELLPTDRFFRKLGIHRYAKRFVSEMPEKTKHRLAAESYLKGVNHFIDNGPKSALAFWDLGKPEPFTLVDMVSVAAYMAFSFDRGLRVDSWYYDLNQKVSVDYVRDIKIEEPVLSLSDEASLSQSGLLELAQIEESMNRIGRFDGSNAWVLSGSRSKSGKPLFANDTHIKFSNPSVWYEAYLKTPEMEIYGHYLAGLAFPILGHSPEHAWGVTIFHNNDVDLVFEDLHWDDQKRLRTKSKEMVLQSHEETIRVRAGEDEKIRVYESNLGPIFPDLFDDGKIATIRWNYYHQTTDNLEGFYDLITAGTLPQAQAAIGKIVAPSLNFLYANTSGDIAWWARGTLHEFEQQIDTIKPVLSGEMGDSLSDDNNPYVENPVTGVIASTNEQPWPQIPGYYSYPERKRRLQELLSSQEKWSLEELKAVQNDVTVAFHRPIIEQLAQNLDDASQQKLAWKQMDAWTGEHEIDSLGPALFYEFCYELLRLTFADEMGEKSFKTFLRTEIAMKTLMHMNESESSLWWDDIKTEAKETKALIYQQAFNLAHQTLVDRYGADAKDWTWGKDHQLTFQHPLGRLPLLGQFFDIGPFPVAGGMETLNQIAFTFGTGPRNPTFGPATRRLVDFADPRRSQGSIPTGQSERVIDPHFKDQVDMFVDGKYRERVFDVDLNEEGTSLLVLKPDESQNLIISKKNDPK